MSEAAILRAIELNGVAIDANQRAFRWGRRAAVDLEAVERAASPVQPVTIQIPESLATLVKRHVTFLTSYQNAAYAAQYVSLVEEVKAAEAKLDKSDKLAKAVANALFKLMAYKDEYEVARLYADSHFTDKLAQQFEGKLTLKFNLAPPLLSKKDGNGHLLKAEYGSWMLKAFAVLARFKGLRGTRLDPFGWTAERKIERQLIVDYRALVKSLLATLEADKLALATEIAALPIQVRGFGHVKEAAVARYRADLDKAMQRYVQGQPQLPSAA
jgi:indolepyruvate ferredoxin oxidoreductase